MADATSSETLPIVQASGEAATSPPIDSYVSLPLLTIDATALRGAAPSSEATLPLPLADGYVEPIHTLPLIEGSGEAFAGDVGQSVERLPAITGQAQAGTSPLIASAAELSPISGTGDALSQRVGQSAHTLAIIGAESAAVSSRVAASSAMLPAMTGAGQAQTEDPAAVFSSAVLPMVTGTGAGLSSRFASSAEVLPRVVADALAFAQAVASSGQVLPVWTGTASAQASRAGESSLSLPAFTGAAAGAASREAVSDLALPMWSASQSQAAGHLATSVLVLPVWVAQSEGVTDQSALVETRKTFAVNMETFAQARDEGLQFNSVARLGALFIGATDEGLYLLGGHTDDGQPINALAKFPTQDDEGAALRRVESMVVGYRTDGEMRLTVETDDGDPQEYVLESVGGLDCHPNRVKIGKGMKGRYWTMTLENVDGSDFATDKVDIDWHNLSRRTR